MKTFYTLLFISIAFTHAIGQKTELVYKAKWVKPIYNAQYNKVFTTDSSITASFFANDSFRTKDLKLSIADGFMVTTQYNTKGELLWSSTIANLSAINFSYVDLMHIDINGNLYYFIYKNIKIQVNGNKEFTAGENGSVLILNNKGEYLKDIAAKVTGISLGVSMGQQSKYQGVLVLLQDTVSYGNYFAKILPDGSIDTLSKQSYSSANVPFSEPSYYDYDKNELYWLFTWLPGKGDLVVNSNITIKEPLKDQHARMVVLKLNAEGEIELVAQSNEVRYINNQSCFLSIKDDKLLMGITFNAYDTFKINSRVISNGKSYPEAALVVLDDKNDVEYQSLIDVESTGDAVLNFKNIGVEGNYLNALLLSYNESGLDGGFEWDDAVGNKSGLYQIKIDLSTWKVQEAVRSLRSNDLVYSKDYNIVTMGATERCYATYLKGNDSVSFDGEFRYGTTADQTMSILAMADTQTVLLPNSIESAKHKSAFSLYPNPSSSQVQLVFANALKEKSSLSIYNSQGKLVYSSTIAKGRQQQSINVADLGKGIYFVQVASSKQISHSSLAIE